MQGLQFVSFSLLLSISLQDMWVSALTGKILLVCCFLYIFKWKQPYFDVVYLHGWFVDLGMGPKKHLSIKIGNILVIWKKIQPCVSVFCWYILGWLSQRRRSYLIVSVIPILLLSGETGEDIHKALIRFCLFLLLQAWSLRHQQKTIESAWFLLFIVQYTVELGHSLFVNSAQENKIHCTQPCRMGMYLCW